MIFKQWKQVLDGTKTQTRRLVKLGEYAITDRLGTYDEEGEWSWDVHTVVYRNNGHMKWQTGQTYAVQPSRGKKSVGRIRMTKIRREKLQDIKPHEFKLEGMPTGVALEVLWWSQMWNEIHQFRRPNRWEDNPEVWVLDFELVKA